MCSTCLCTFVRISEKLLKRVARSAGHRTNLLYWNNVNALSLREAGVISKSNCLYECTYCRSWNRDGEWPLSSRPSPLPSPRPAPASYPLLVAVDANFIRWSFNSHVTAPECNLLGNVVSHRIETDRSRGPRSGTAEGLSLSPYLIALNDE